MRFETMETRHSEGQRVIKGVLCVWRALLNPTMYARNSYNLGSRHVRYSEPSDFQVARAQPRGHRADNRHSVKSSSRRRSNSEGYTMDFERRTLAATMAGVSVGRCIFWPWQVDICRYQRRLRQSAPGGYQTGDTPST